jgi:electron transfer flavoprotein beta subunit
MVGEGSTDNYSGQFGPRLAELLDLPALTYVKQLEYVNGKMKATRNMEESFEIVESALPALVVVTSGINEPRIPSLMQILKGCPETAAGMERGGFRVHRRRFSPKRCSGVSNLAPVELRKKIIFEGKLEENVDNLVNNLIKEGVLRG